MPPSKYVGLPPELCGGQIFHSAVDDGTGTHDGAWNDNAYSPLGDETGTHDEARNDSTYSPGDGTDTLDSLFEIFYSSPPLMGSRDWDLAIRIVAMFGQAMTPAENEAWLRVFRERVDGEQALDIATRFILRELTTFANMDYSLRPVVIWRIENDLDDAAKSTYKGPYELEALVDIALNSRIYLVDHKVSRPITRLRDPGDILEYIVSRHLWVNRSIYIQLKDVSSNVNTILKNMSRISAESAKSALVTRHMSEWENAPESLHMKDWYLVDPAEHSPEQLPSSIMSILVDLREMDYSTLYNWCQRAMVVVLVNGVVDRPLLWDESLVLASCLDKRVGALSIGVERHRLRSDPLTHRMLDDIIEIYRVVA